MNRRTFLQWLLFTCPALHLDSYDCLGGESRDAYAVEDAAHGLSIFFIGDYGRRILREYRKRKIRYPGSVPVIENIGLDIIEEGEIILTKIDPVIQEAMPKRNRSKLGIFVLDTQDEEGLSIAEDFCLWISQERMARAICLAPEWPAKSLIRTLFNVVLDEQQQRRRFNGSGPADTSQYLPGLQHILRLSAFNASSGHDVSPVFPVSHAGRRREVHGKAGSRHRRPATLRAGLPTHPVHDTENENPRYFGGERSR